jgi:RNA-directed DNA polymerase
MREPYRKGVASHPGPESCVASRNAGNEALTGVQAGRAIERRNGAYFRGPALSSNAEGNRVGVDSARTGRPQRRPLRETSGPEGRRSIKANTVEVNPSWTQSREIGSRGLQDVREAAGRDKELRFTAPAAPCDRRTASEQLLRATAASCAGSGSSDMCANERPHGSVRGVPGNRHPCRDPIAPFTASSRGWC